METTTEWWKPEYGFFGKFYECGDNSICGWDSTKKLSREERTIYEVESVVKLLGIKANSKLFDCPCGFGRHSRLLAEKFDVNVTGIDLHPEYLITANNPPLPRLKLVESDMRRISFDDCFDSFDFGINMFTSFGFFSDEDNICVIRNFYKMLKKGGKMLLHFDYNGDRIISGDYLGQKDEFINRDIFSDSHSKRLNITETYDYNTKRLSGSWSIVNGKTENKSYDFRIYGNEELVNTFLNEGFTKAEVLNASGTKIEMDDKETFFIATK